MNRTILYSLAALLLTIGATSLAADWAQWRGPLRSGISEETGLSSRWPESGPQLLWLRKEIGDGYSTPAVVGDHIYLLANEGMEDELVKALAVADGAEIWSTRIGSVGPNRGPQYPGARGTATLEGDRLYAIGSNGDLVCLDAASGKILWQKSLTKEFNGAPGRWAYSESPLIDGNLLICTPGGSEATVVALDKSNGDLVWKCAVEGGDEAAYASVVIGNFDGVKQYVQFLQNGLVGIQADNGAVLWRYGRTAEGSPANIPTPIIEGDYVYSSAGRSGGALVQVQRSADGWKAEEVYFQTKLPNGIGGAVLVDGYLYGTTRESLMCVEFKTGDVKWEDRSIGAASVCYADGKLFLHGENGDLALVAASPESYQELGRLTPADQPDRGESQAWTHPVISDGKLFIRDLDRLWSYDVKQ